VPSACDMENPFIRFRYSMFSGDVAAPIDGRYKPSVAEGLSGVTEL
jgi:hypothetical protein